jgi:regulator of protease activity HflC (stomatin/prohibitin superfamily)
MSLLARRFLTHSSSRLVSSVSVSSSRVSSSSSISPSFLTSRRTFFTPSSSAQSTHGKPNFGLVIVPQQSAYVIEWFGKFDRVLTPGIHFLIPMAHRIAYIHNLKEQAIPVTAQQAITADNVTIGIDGVLYIKIVDPEKASYGIADIYFAMTQLAQTAMRSELGKMTLDKLFGERESLNQSIVKGISAAAEPWGIECLRYEIRDIDPPPSVMQAMHLQAEAERQKRATILNSEGQQQSAINVAEGQRQATALAAQGESEAILRKADATAKGISMLSKSIAEAHGVQAVSMLVAEQYITAFSHLAKTNNTMLLPSNPSDPSSMIAQAMAIFANVNKTNNNLPINTNTASITQQSNKASEGKQEETQSPPSSESTTSVPVFNPQSGRFE